MGPNNDLDKHTWLVFPNAREDRHALYLSQGLVSVVG